MSRRSRILQAASAVLLILACIIAGCTSTSAPAPSATATPAPAASAPPAISIKNMAFSPATLTVKPGTTVTWTNDDITSHTVVSDENSPVAYTSPLLASGASFPFTFTQAGTYSYHCGIHPSMKGTILVQP